MARTVADAAILLGALTGVDPRDAATRRAPRRRTTDYTRFLDRQRTARRAHRRRAEAVLRLQRRDRRVVDDAIDVMKAQGAVIVDPAEHRRRRGSSTTASSTCCCTSSRPT